MVPVFSCKSFPASNWLNEVPQKWRVPMEEGQVLRGREMNSVFNMFDIITLTVDTFSLPCTPLYSAQASHHSFEFCSFYQITTLCLLLVNQARPLKPGSYFTIGNEFGGFSFWVCLCLELVICCNNAFLALLLSLGPHRNPTYTDWEAPLSRGWPRSSELLLWKEIWEQENVLGHCWASLVVHMKIMPLSFGRHWSSAYCSPGTLGIQRWVKQAQRPHPVSSQVSKKKRQAQRTHSLRKTSPPPLPLPCRGLLWRGYDKSHTKSLTSM